MNLSNERWARYKSEVEAKLDFTKIFCEIEGAKSSGNGCMVGRCPFHDDHNPSFGFSTTTGIWECFAGCGKGGPFDYLMRRSNKEFKGVLLELGDELGVPRPFSNGDGNGQVVYTYRAEDGTGLFQVVRGPGKKFWQRRPDGKGGYVKGIPGVRRVLYRLPELLARPNERVFVVEGEKDTDRLHSDGLLTTTNPGGAGKWRDEYSAFLKNRDVVILPDNDGPGREHAAQVARALIRVAATTTVVELPGLPEKGDVSDWLAAGHTAAELQDLVGKSTAWTLDAAAVDRPVIVIGDRQLRDVIDETWRVLLAQNDPPRLFVSAGQLSRLVDGETGPRIQYVDETTAYGILVRAADWFAQYGKQLVNTKPPKDVARDLLANPHPDLPPLEAVVTTPLFDREWRLINHPGFHRDARLWLHLPGDGADYEIPLRPTGDDLAVARALIVDELLHDFPFAADSDLAHAVAALLLPFVRRMFDGPTPIHLIEAPTPGSGKGLLADLVSLVNVGRSCESTTITRNEDECRKKLTAILSRGHPVVVLDNLQGAVDSAQIAAAITAEIWSDRILGKTQMVEFPNRALWIMTANNPRLSTEIARRCVRIRINPAEEHPWTRTGFKHDPIRDWAKQNRHDLVRAILVIIQSWITTDGGHATQTRGSFESWSRLVGGIIRHLDLPGFLGDADEFYAAADAEGAEWRAFCKIWWDDIGAGAVGVQALMALAEEHNLVLFALDARKEHGKKIKFAKALQGLRGRKFDNLEVATSLDAHTKTQTYRLIPLGEELVREAGQ